MSCARYGRGIPWLRAKPNGVPMLAPTAVFGDSCLVLGYSSVSFYGGVLVLCCTVPFLLVIS